MFQPTPMLLGLSTSRSTGGLKESQRAEGCEAGVDSRFRRSEVGSSSVPDSTAPGPSSYQFRPVTGDEYNNGDVRVHQPAPPKKRKVYNIDDQELRDMINDLHDMQKL